MKLTGIDYSNYSRPDASFSFTDGEGNLIRLRLKEEEVIELQAFSQRLFEKNQQRLANSVASMRFPALAAPDAVDAEFSEVNDDVPF